MLYFILRVLSIPSDHFQELFIVSVKIGHFSLFWSKNRTPFRFWPSLAHFLGVFCSLTIMQICFQISIVYPRRALSASVCVVAVAGAGLSLQIQFSLKIRATLSSSSPGFFIASFCPASLYKYKYKYNSLSKYVQLSHRHHQAFLLHLPLIQFTLHLVHTRQSNGLKSNNFKNTCNHDNNLMTIKWPQK